MTCVRWRADPKKIRVSIKRDGEAWSVTVKERATGLGIYSSSMDPERAVEIALSSAHYFDGVDLDMQWAYEHPFR